MVWKCHNWVMVFIRWNLMSVSVAVLDALSEG